MENTPCKFSIIIPVYNVEPYLRRCVDSVLFQSFNDYEIILVDDGSPDRCGEICDEYARNNKSVKCIHRENGGISVARNTGLNAATGEYVIFVDSDDMWSDPDALKTINDAFCKNPKTQVLCFGYRLFSSDGTLRKECIPKSLSDNRLDKYSVLKALTDGYHYYNAAYVKALRRDFLVENKIFFVPGILSEDIGWSGEILVKAQHFDVLSSGFYSYMLRKSGSVTSNVCKKKVLDVLCQIENALKEIPLEENDLNLRELYYEYWAYQYAALLGDVPYMKNESDYKSTVERLKKCAHLLNYDHVKKVRAVKYLYKFFGISITMKILHKYLQLNWRRN